MEMTAVFMCWHFAQLEMNHNILYFLRLTCENICCSALHAMKGTFSWREGDKKRVKETVMLEIIGTCRSIEDGNMVECEACKEWFHQGCLTVPQSVVEVEKTFSTMDVSFMREKVETIQERNIVVCIQSDCHWLSDQLFCVCGFYSLMLLYYL